MREKFSSTALHAACKLGKPNVVRVLLRSGLPPSAVDIADDAGATPLCYAAGFRAPNLWRQSDYKPDSQSASPADKEARLECVELLLGAEQANYIAMDGPSRALKLQHVGSALATAQLAGYSAIVARLEHASREEELRGQIKQQFDVTKAQNELVNLETLGSNFVKDRGVEDSQAAALKQALDERAASLRQWMQQHEDKLTKDAAERSQTEPDPQSKLGHPNGAKEEELFVLSDPKFQPGFEAMESQKARFLKWHRETAAWLEQEHAIIQKAPTPLRRLCGNPAGTQPVTLNNTGSDLLVDFGDNTSGTKQTTQIVGSPTLMMKTPGVLYYEVVVESDLPGRGYAYDSLSFGFAGPQFEYGIEDVDRIGTRTVSTDLAEPSNSWAAVNGRSLDLFVGDVTGRLNPGPSGMQIS